MIKRFRSWMATVPVWVHIGVFAAAVATAALGALVAASYPWAGTADSVYHLDYVYQVWLGQLPEPTGLALPNVSTELASTRQYASAHPPLFYLLVAPLVGSLLDQGMWEQATVIVRAFNIVLGVVTIFGLARAGWEIGGSYRNTLTVAAAGTGAITVPFTRMMGDVYSDILLTTAATWMVAYVFAVLRRGATWPRILILSTLAVVGMGAKATFIITIAIAMTCVFVAQLVHSRGTLASRIGGGFVKAVAIIAAPVVAFGWFYARNAELSGAWYRSTPKTALQGRPERSMMENLTNPDFWLILPTRFLGNTETRMFGVPLRVIAIAVFATAAFLLLSWALRGRRFVTLARSVTFLFAILATVGQVVGLYVAQLSHATGYGGYNIWSALGF